jgi:16S rRNA (guanine1516-N2)-methyltransferase
MIPREDASTHPTSPDLTVGVMCEATSQMERAHALARRLSLPLITGNDMPVKTGLMVTENGLELRDLSGTGPSETLRPDLVKGALGYRRQHGGGVRQALARAVGVKGRPGLRLLDATAGLGRDGFMLAWLGCSVHLLERSPIIAALLEDALARAWEAPELRDVVEARIELTCGDSIELLPRLTAGTRWDAIYLDPMYPERSKAALVKKEMRWLRGLVGPDQDSARLLRVALACTANRVVVKRPKGAPMLEGPDPSFEIREKNSRFDVYSMPS